MSSTKLFINIPHSGNESSQSSTNNVNSYLKSRRSRNGQFSSQNSFTSGNGASSNTEHVGMEARPRFRQLMINSSVAGNDNNNNTEATVAAAAPALDPNSYTARMTAAAGHHNFNNYEDFKEFIRYNMLDNPVYNASEHKLDFSILSNFSILFNKIGKASTSHIAVGGHRLNDRMFLKIYLYIPSVQMFNTNQLSLEKFYREVYFQKAAVNNIKYYTQYPLAGFEDKDFKVPAVHHFGEININSDMRNFYSGLNGTLRNSDLCMAYIIMDHANGSCIQSQGLKNAKLLGDVWNMYRSDKLFIDSELFNKNITNSIQKDKKCFLLDQTSLYTIVLYVHSLLQRGDKKIYHNDLGYGNNILYNPDTNTFTIIDFGEANDIDNSVRSFAFYVKHGWEPSFGGSRRKRHTRKRKIAKRKTAKRKQRHTRY